MLNEDCAVAPNDCETNTTCVDVDGGSKQCSEYTPVYYYLEYCVVLDVLYAIYCAE